MRRYLPDAFVLALLATVLLASLLPLRGASVEPFSRATDAAIALLFVLHGARLSRYTVIEGLLNWRLHITVLFVTFVVFPHIGLLVGLIPHTLLPAPLSLGILYLCLLPSTVQSSIAFTSIAGGNVPAAIVSASGSNILGMVLTPVMVGLLMTLDGRGNGFSVSALENIMLQLLAPFLVGQILQPWIGGWIRRHGRILKPVDRGSILMVVYLAFSHAVVDGIWLKFTLADLAVVALIDLALLALVLALTIFGSRLLGFKRADEIVIAFCGSKKSLASGVPMANAIFPAAMIGPIVLPLMIFHQLQLMVCAVIAARYAHAGKVLKQAAAAAASNDGPVAADGRATQPN